MKEIKFSSLQDPTSWEPNTDRGGVITCATPTDAKKAEALFSEMAGEIQLLQTALRQLVYQDEDGAWRVGMHGDSDVTGIVTGILGR